MTEERAQSKTNFNLCIVSRLKERIRDLYLLIEIEFSLFVALTFLLYKNFIL